MCLFDHVNYVGWMVHYLVFMVLLNVGKDKYGWSATCTWMRTWEIERCNKEYLI